MTSVIVDRASESPSNPMRTIVLAGSIGTVIEWYDFLVYTTLAGLVLSKIFFPTTDPNVGLLAALATYAVGFLARPLGGAIFGHYGDRFGRKSMLMATMVIMGLATFAIGLLPTYKSIGFAAPVILVVLRIIQGIGLGGEWGGASLFVLEHAPSRARGLFGSLVQIGYPLGLVLSTLAVALVVRLSEADLLAWGWRLPFLASAALLFVGAFVRSRISETPVFVEMQAKQKLCQRPFVEAVTKERGSFLLAVGLKLTEVTWVYMLSVFTVLYATTKLGLSKSLILDAVLYAALLELITIPFFGWLSDQIGRRILFILGALFTIGFAFPFFWMIQTKSPAIVVAAIIIAMNFGHGMMFALESTYFPELFKGPVRCSGASFGFQLSAAIGGGLAPIIATGIVGQSATTMVVSLMLVVIALVTLFSAFKAKETLDADLSGEEGDLPA
jgi:MHS family shikimate/dehydroshikimate transporter-like MFS transporter